jgi:hypothetical protein
MRKKLFLTGTAGLGWLGLTVSKQAETSAFCSVVNSNLTKIVIVSSSN